MCVPSEKQHLKDSETDFPYIPELQKTDNTGIILNDRKCFRSFLISTLGSFTHGFQRHEQKNDPGQVGLVKEAELSFICMAGPVLSVWGIFKMGLQVILVLTDSNRTLPSLHSLPINKTYPKFSIDSLAACYSLQAPNCNSSAVLV